MAVVIEMPLHHPARHPNPFNLKKSASTSLDCPFGCGEKFAGHWKLYLHLLQYHPEQRGAR
jgi:hypothetical protein